MFSKLALFFSALALLLGSVTAQAQQPTEEPDTELITLWEPLLRPTEECQLPCWWGIRPGISTMADVEDAIKTLFSRSSTFTTTNNDIDQEQTFAGAFQFEAFPDLASPISIVATYDHNGFVESIKLASGDRFSDGIETQLAWSYFDIGNAVQQYGIPDAINLFAVQYDAPGIVTNNLWLYWETKGIAIGYTSCVNACDTFFAGEQAPLRDSVCYSLDSLGLLQVVLLASDTRKSLYEVISYWGREARDLSEISELTPADLIQIILDNDECIPFDVPIEAFEH